MFAHQRQRLGAHGTIAVADLTRRDTITAMASDILAGAPPKFTAVGLSMGAVVAVEIARCAPDRLKGLVLMDTNLAPARPDQIIQRREWSAQALNGHLTDVVRTHLLQLMTSARGPLDQIVLDMAHSVGAAAFVRQNEALISREDMRPILPLLNIPTLVVCGDRDVYCPVELHRDFAGRLADSEMRIVGSCGHLSSLEQPHAVTELLLEWMQRRAGW